MNHICQQLPVNLNIQKDGADCIKVSADDTITTLFQAIKRQCRFEPTRMAIVNSPRFIIESYINDYSPGITYFKVRDFNLKTGDQLWPTDVVYSPHLIPKKTITLEIVP